MFNRHVKHTFHQQAGQKDGYVQNDQIKKKIYIN